MWCYSEAKNLVLLSPKLHCQRECPAPLAIQRLPQATLVPFGVTALGEGACGLCWRYMCLYVFSKCNLNNKPSRRLERLEKYCSRGTHNYFCMSSADTDIIHTWLASLRLGTQERLTNMCRVKQTLVRFERDPCVTKTCKITLCI